MSSSGIGPGIAEFVGAVCIAFLLCSSAAVPPSKSNSLVVCSSLSITEH